MGTHPSLYLALMTHQELLAAAQHHEIMWRMYGEQQDFVALTHINKLLADGPTESAAPAIFSEQEQCNPKSASPTNKKKHHLAGRPSPLKGRKLSPEHLAKLRKPKTEAQKAALRVPKKHTAKMGKYERTDAIRKAAAKAAKGRKKTDEEKRKIGAAKRGEMNPKYQQYTFAASHPQHGMFYGERMQLHKRFPRSLPLHELRKLALGEYRTYKGWVLLQACDHGCAPPPAPPRS